MSNQSEGKLNKTQVDEIVRLHRYNYSHYTISCLLGIDTGTIDRAVMMWEESQIPAGGGRKGRK